jgi:long-chain acyl-CoA synthetase
VNLAELIETHPAEAPAMISRGRRTSYGELREQVAGLRGGLTGLGVRPGDRVAIVANNNWYFVVGYLAALGVGAVAVPLNPQAPPAELSRELATVGASAVLIGPAARAACAQVDRTELPRLEHRIGAGFRPEGGVELDELMAADPVPLVDRADEDPAVLCFTSGTAGSPRAAVLTHRNLSVNLRQLEAASEEGPRADDVVFGLLPMFHIFGLNVVLGSSLAVGSCVLLIERFDPVSALEAIEKHEVTSIAGPPTMWAAFAGLAGVGPDAMSTVRVASSGAA